MRGGRLHDQIDAVGQALHANVAGIIAEDFGQLILIGTPRGLPAIALAVLVVARRSQRPVIGGNFIGVDLVGLGNGLRLTGEIPLGVLVVVFLVEVGIQNALQSVASGAGLVKLLDLGQVGHKIEGEPGTLQLQPIGLPAGGDDLADLHVTLGDLILTFGQAAVLMDMVVAVVGGCVIGKGGFLHIPALVCIAGRDVVVMLIAEISGRIGQVIGIVGPGAVQSLALRDGAKLVLVYPICILPVAGCQRGNLPGNCLGAAVHRRIGAGNSKSALTQRNDRAGGALYYIIFTEVQVCEGQPAVLDFCTGYEIVLFQYGQIIADPLPAVVTNRRVPDRFAVGIYDFGIIHNAGHTIRVGNILGGVQVVHCAVQHGIAVRSVACHIPLCIQINLRDADFAQRAVIFHDTVRRRGGVAVLIGSLAAGIGGIAPGGILGGVIDGDGGFYAAAGRQLCAALIASGNVGIVVTIAQPQDRIVVVSRNFHIVGALAQRCARRAGMVNVCPVAEIPRGGLRLHKDEPALIALRVVQCMAHRVVCGVGGVVDDGIGAVTLALDAVGVVPTRWPVFAGHDVPLVDFIPGIACNLVAGLAVGLFDVDLQRPLCISHLVGAIGVGRYCNGLVTAVAAPVGFKAVGNGDFVITELQRCKLCLRAGNSIIYSALCFCLNGGNRRIALAVGGCVRGFFRSIGADAATAAIYGLGYSVMHRPAGRCCTAVILVIVVVGVAACSDGLHTGRGDAPAAAVNCSGLGDRLDFNRGIVHLFQRFQLDFICGDTIGQIHGAAGGLCRGFPIGIILLYDRLRLFRFLLTDFRANQGNGLPTAARRGINVGIVAAGLCIGNSAVQQGLRGFQIDFCSSALRVVLNQPQLGIVVNRVAEIQKRDSFSIFCR